MFHEAYLGRFQTFLHTQRCSLSIIWRQKGKRLSCAVYIYISYIHRVWWSWHQAVKGRNIITFSLGGTYFMWLSKSAHKLQFTFPESIVVNLQKQPVPPPPLQLLHLFCLNFFPSDSVKPSGEREPPPSSVQPEAGGSNWQHTVSSWWKCWPTKRQKHSINCTLKNQYGEKQNFTVWGAGWKLLLWWNLKHTSSRWCRWTVVHFLH